jgi:asparagine synthetase B (glutamine-hydrolysing)
MCSFLVTNILEFTINYVNEYLKNRGPDKTSNIIINNIRFIHNLLNITGNITVQPFIDNDIVCLYNGEIYNYNNFGNYNSDGECLIPLYKKYGKNFIKELDGEFAIILFDFTKNIVIISTDVFATKPLWYCYENNNFGISTYHSSLSRLNFVNSKKLDANTTLILDLNNFEIIEKINVYEFDLNQYKCNYDDWINAFEKSIDKRTNNLKYGFYVCLSSGYDSGAICCALNKLNKKYYTYTLTTNENMDILNKRYIINKKNCIKSFKYELTDNDFINEKKEFQSICENFTYNVVNVKNQNCLYNDNASYGGSFICKRANNDNLRIFLSGQGADEIISDYGFNGKKIFSHSNFGGLFPDNLGDIFPWESFYKSTQESYLMKEEMVSGAHGIEGRYPFLDKNLVQEFLWLKPELKNKNYKSVLFEYLTKNNYPFENKIKRGFNPINF